MIGRVAALLCAAAMTVAVPATAQTSVPPFSSLTVFGDSLVDAGNIRKLGLGADPALGYVDGRFTNGYDYTDLLSLAMYGTPTVASLNGGSNFAYGGARATDTTPVVLTVNGTTATVAADGTFEVEHALSQGANTLELLLTDAVGNKSYVDKPADVREANGVIHSTNGISLPKLG